VISDEGFAILLSGREARLSSGKKKHAVLRPS